MMTGDSEGVAVDDGVVVPVGEVGKDESAEAGALEVAETGAETGSLAGAEEPPPEIGTATAELPNGNSEHLPGSVTVAPLVTRIQNGWPVAVS